MARHRLFWLSSGGFLLLTSALLLWLSQSAAPSANVFVALELVAGAGFLLAVWYGQRHPATLAFRYVLLIGIGCRLFLLPSVVLFDDDIHRYLWDGKVLAHGINPYRHPPLSFALWELQDDNWQHIGYPEIRTIYPPLAEGVFALAWLFGLRTILALKCLFFLFDVANILLIALLLKRWQLPACWSLGYAWSPLVLKEFANSGHLEPVLLFFVLVMFFFLLRERPRYLAAGMSFALAVLTKFVPLLWLPLLWRRGRWRFAVPALLVIIAGFLPFLGAGKYLCEGALTFSRDWTFNGGIFALLDAGQQWVLHGMVRLPFQPLRGLIMLVTVGYALASMKHVRMDDAREVLTPCLRILALCLLLSPTVDPWYLCWMLPLLCFRANPALLLWTVTVMFSYLYYAHHTFPAWIPLAEYLPVGVVLLAEWWMARRRASVALVPLSPQDGRAFRRSPGTTEQSASYRDGDGR